MKKTHNAQRSPSPSRSPEPYGAGRSAGISESLKIEHISMLARLELTEEEKNLFSKQIGSIIEYMDKLNELDTSSVEPTAHVLPMKNVLRADELKPSLPNDKALQNAPNKTNGFYKVPKIIE